MTLRIKFVIEDVDRYGNVRLYFRRKGQRKIRLPGVPGSREFQETYDRAIAGSPAVENLGTSRHGEPGSLKALCENYYRAAEFKALDLRSQRVRRSILDDLCRRHGAKPARMMAPRHIRKLRDEKADRPVVANALVKALRQVFAAGVNAGLAGRNPARDVPYLKPKKPGGFHSWSPEEIEAFERAHPIGSKARLAFALLYLTGQRRSDVVRFGKQHVRDGVLTFTQQKSRQSKPVTLSLPMVQELRQVVDASPCGELAFLVTEFGKPFSSAGFGNWFRVRCDEAGLPHCSAHGLRKAAAARLAELGASEAEIWPSRDIEHRRKSADTRAARVRKFWLRGRWLSCRPVKAGTKVSHFQVFDPKSETLLRTKSLF